MIERIDVVCTGGLYDDPEEGPTPRHPRQKLGRLFVAASGHQDKVLGDYRVGHSHERKQIKCPQCGRRVPVGVAVPTPEGVEGGVWQRILDHANEQFPDRRVVVVDISDTVYSW